MADHVEDQILGEHARLQVALHQDPPHLELVHRQALAGEHIAHLAGADTEGDRPEGAVGGGVRIAAGDRHARLAEPQLRRDHMDDALAAAAEAMQGDAVLGAVALQGGEHLLGEGIGKGTDLGGGGHDVIHSGHSALGMAYTQAQLLQGGEGLWAGHLMDEVQADEQLGGPSGQLRHAVHVPDLVVQRAGAHRALQAQDRSA